MTAETTAMRAITLAFSYHETGATCSSIEDDNVDPWEIEDGSVEETVLVFDVDYEFPPEEIIVHVTETTAHLHSSVEGSRVVPIDTLLSELYQLAEARRGAIARAGTPRHRQAWPKLHPRPPGRTHSLT